MPTASPFTIDRCPICNEPAHASETGDDGVCAACLAAAPAAEAEEAPPFRRVSYALRFLPGGRAS